MRKALRIITIFSGVIGTAASLVLICIYLEDVIAYIKKRIGSK